MELEFHIYEEYIGKHMISGYEYGKLSAKEKEAALYHNAEVMVETAEKAGHDAIRSISSYWEIVPGVPAFLWLPDNEAVYNQLRALKKVAGDEFYLLGTVSATFSIPEADKIMEFSLDLFEKPEELKASFNNKLETALEFQKKQLDAGADAIVNASDVAFNTGTFLSPEAMEEFFYPYFLRWVDSLKSQGIPSIWHTDGNLNGIVARILQTGVTALQCIDPLAGMDIVSLMEELEGKLCLIGNINCANLCTGSAEEIEAEARQVIEGCKNRAGFILSCCNAVFEGIPAESYEILVQSRRNYGTIKQLYVTLWGDRIDQ